MWGWVAVGVMMALGLAGSNPAAGEPRVYETKTWAQDRIIHSTAPEVAVSGGWYSGKTSPACVLAHKEAVEHPGIEIALCREERSAMTMSTLREFLEAVLPLQMRTWNHAKGCGWKSDDSAVYYPRVNGRRSVVWVVGLDKPERLFSANPSIIIIDQAEQITLDQFMKAQSRCARQADMPNGRIVMLFNPEHPDHWANQRYQFALGSRELRDASGEVQAEVVVCDPNDAMVLAPPRYRAVLERLTGTYRERYRLNRWTGFAGSVFEVWNPNVHLIEKPDLWARWGGYPPPAWPRYRGIDFGYYPDPFVLAWWAESPERKFYRYREIYHTKRLVEDHAKQAVALEERELQALRGACTTEEAETLRPYLGQLYVLGSWSDHDREDQETLNRHGIWSNNAKKDDIVAGLQTCIGMLDPAQPGGSRIFLIRNATVERDPLLTDAEPRRPACGEEEMAGYRWNKIDASGTKRQLPVDRDQHFIDGGFRYVFHSMEDAVQVAVY